MMHDQKTLQLKDDIKIFILYLLHNLNRPLEYEVINDIVVQDEIVRGLDFVECFAELVDAGNIIEINEKGHSYYIISDRGVTIVQSLQSQLLPYIRTKSLKSAFRLLSYKERGSEIKSSYERRSDGKFDVCCQIIDERQLSLEIKIVADNERQLIKIRENFDDRPEVMYRGVLALLTGEIDYLLD